MPAFFCSVAKWMSIIVLSLLVIGFLYERISRKRIEKLLFSEKTFARINGSNIHYVKKGSGSFTVVFVSGMGSGHYIWKTVQDELSGDAVTIAYDRNGIMLSDDNVNVGVTNQEISKELETLLQQTGCPGPYLLVAHSMASTYLRPFIESNKHNIAGIVFAEAVHPLQKQRASDALRASRSIPPRWVIDAAIHSGLYRLLFSFKPVSAEIPLKHPLHAMEKNLFYRTYKKLLEELQYEDRNFADAAVYNSFDAIPLTVISGTSAIRYSAIKDARIRNEYLTLTSDMQLALAQLSSRSRQVLVPGSGHLLQVNHSDVLAAEISRMIALYGLASVSK